MAALMSSSCRISSGTWFKARADRRGGATELDVSMAFVRAHIKWWLHLALHRYPQFRLRHLLHLSPLPVL